MNWWKLIIEWLTKASKDKAVKPVVVPEVKPTPAPTPAPVDGPKDALLVSCIAGYSHQGGVWKDWPITHALGASLGGKLTVNSKALTTWPNVDDICGACWFIVWRNSGWRAYCWDYIRRGQTSRDWPRRKDKPVDYETVNDGEECYVVITGLCRDKRRNVSERTNIVRVQ